MKKRKKHSFIMQAGLLAAAGIIVRIIGILYRTPLVMIIGDEGNGYYNTAYQIYMIILFISSYSIPAAISKVIAAKLSLNEYRNAYRLFIGGIIYVLIMGTLGSAVCFLFPNMLVGANSAQVLKIFAPTILLSGFLGTFRGFFQAQHTMLYTSSSQIIEQIANAVISITMAFIFTRNLVGMDDTTVAIAGAKGSAIGTGAGVAVALVYMVVIYCLHHKDIITKVKKDNSGALEGWGDIFKIILGMVTPVILSTCIYNITNPLNLKIYQGITMNVRGMSESIATTRFGLYSAKAMQIINIPIAIAAAMSSAIIPAISHTHERGEYEEGRRKVAMAVKVTMLIAIPCAFGLFVLAKPILLILYPQKASVDLVASMIRVLSITVVFYCMSTLSNAVLQGTGHAHAPVVNASIALGIQTVVLVILMITTDLDTYALCISAIVYSLAMCVLNGIAMRKYNGYHQEVVKTFVLPAAASLWMGLLVKASYDSGIKLLGIIFGGREFMLHSISINNVIATAVSVVIGAFIYLLLILHYGVATEQDILSMPKGTKLVSIFTKLGLLREEDIITRRRKRRKKQ